ncbi:hypothetical protein AJ88_15975 [Mesorhizobium amorphae CCBAU 01583]|nr:hypothetical protein AJ88_15975 [Mesorhizobium amorphae CCBAU 01583]
MLQRPAAAPAQVLSSTPEQLGKRARRAWLLFAAAALAITAAALYGAGLYGRSTEIRALAAQGRTDANLKVALLRAVLENPRALPLLLSEDQQVRDALTERNPVAIDVLNRKLEGLVSGTKASVLYVTGIDGLAIASRTGVSRQASLATTMVFAPIFLARCRPAPRNISRSAMSASVRAFTFHAASAAPRHRSASLSSRWSSTSSRSTGTRRTARPMSAMIMASC